MSEGTSKTSISTPAYLLSSKEVSQALRVRFEMGLSAREAKRRQLVWGKNFIPKHKPRSPILVFLDRFKDALVLFLMAAAAVSLALGRPGDAAIIGAAVLLDTLLTYVQVLRTERTLERLRQHLQQTAWVKRQGKMKRVDASELVPGDIIGFRAGEKIPADARLISAQGLKIQESALTGEAEEVTKSPLPLESRSPLGNRINMVYLGTTVMSGRGWAVVTSTGTRTEFGKIAQMLKTQSSPVSPLRKKLNRTGVIISWATVVIVGVVMAINVLMNEPWVNSIRTAVALVVSAIPEDLTVVLTVALTIGVSRILRKKGLVRELASGETLGAATVICTDKTGTLTWGQMKPEAFYGTDGTNILARNKFTGLDLPLALVGMALSVSQQTNKNEAGTFLGSSTERSMSEFITGIGYNPDEIARRWQKRDAVAFDARWKYSANLRNHPTNNGQVLFVVGAPEVLLERSGKVAGKAGDKLLTSAARHRIQADWKRYADQGERLIGVAVRKNMRQASITHREVTDLTFLGVLAISDPVRPDAVQAVAECRSAGVQVKVITGDYEITAKAVARQVGLPTHDDAVLTGAELESMDDRELEQRIEEITVFARVNPIDKQRIVRALQRRGHVVAMTGDGVNDAVALKSADIGIAMGSGKDIAKDASDLVLLDDSFATIVAAVKEGRVIRDNVRKVIAFLLSTNVAEVAIFLTSLVMRLPLPMVPAQILWINLVTDGTSDLALSMEPEEKGVMQRKPEDPQASLLGRKIGWHIILAGLIMTLGASWLYWYLLQAGASLAYARTMVFMFLAVSSLLSTWSYRSLDTLFAKQGFRGNPWLLVSAGFSLALQCAAVYLPSFQRWFETVPLGWRDWGVIMILAVVTVGLMDLRKVVISWASPKQ